MKLAKVVFATLATTLLAGCVFSFVAFQAAVITACGIKVTVDQWPAVQQWLQGHATAQSVDQAASLFCQYATLTPALTGRAHGMHWKVVNKARYDAFKAAHGH